MAQTYFLIPTAAGEAKLANAQALGVPLKFTHMSVGDGNGALPIPNRLRTALINEQRRAPINALTQDPDNASQFIAEQVIPETEGGWWIREAGIHSEDGTLCYYSNIPETYKPVLSEGSARTQVVRLVCLNTSGATVELKVDPAIVLATRGYADTLAAQGRAYTDAQIAAELAKQDGKQSVLVATIGPVAALSGLLTVDGVVLTAGARVLVKDQAVGKDNGIYIAAAGAWARSADADVSIEVTPGLFLTVEQGNVNADSVWQLATDAPITLGTTALVFEMLGGRTGVTAGTYSRVSVDVRGRVTGGTNPTPTESVAAPAMVATDAEVTAGDEDSHIVTPKKLKTRMSAWLGALLVQATETVFGWAKLATQAQTNAGTDDNTIVTPRKLRSGFVFNAAGYIKFPDWMGGLIVQWIDTGPWTGVVPNTVYGVTWAMVFPRGCFGMQICNMNTGFGNFTWSTSVYSTSGANIYTNGSGSTRTLIWSIGY